MADYNIWLPSSGTYATASIIMKKGTLRKHKLQSAALRVIEYRPDGSPWRILIYASAFLDRGDASYSADSIIHLNELWDSNYAPEIVPTYDICSEVTQAQTRQKREKTDKEAEAQKKQEKREETKRKRKMKEEEEAEKTKIMRTYQCKCEPPCNRQFSRIDHWNLHNQANGRLCCANGGTTSFSMPSKPLPVTRYTGIHSDRELTLTILDALRNSPDIPISRGILLTPSTWSEQPDSFSFGWARYKRAPITKIPGEVKEAIVDLLRRGEQCKSKRMQAYQIVEALQSAGIPELALHFPDVPFFQNVTSNGRPRYQPFEIPNVKKIQGVIGTFMAAKKKSILAASCGHADEATRGHVMFYLLRNEWCAELRTIIVSELLYAGVGARINTYTLNQASLKGLPVGDEKDWGREIKRKIVSCLSKQDFSKVEIPADFAEAYCYVQPMPRRALPSEATLSELLGKKIDDDDDDDNDDDDAEEEEEENEEEVERREAETELQKFEDANILPASQVDGFMARYVVSRLQEKVGKVFKDKFGRGMHECKIVDVVVYDFDVNTYFFKYEHKGANSRKKHTFAYTKVSEFKFYKDGRIEIED